MRTFSTPDAAAMDGLPAAHCRVVASSVDGDDAFVVIDTGPLGSSHLDGTTVRRVDGGWMVVASGNGGGWTLTDPEQELGTLHVWGEAPAGATAMRVARGDEVREVPVQNGVYLATWWRVPAEDGLSISESPITERDDAAHD